jgi:hypothetical protein
LTKNSQINWIRITDSVISAPFLAEDNQDVESILFDSRLNSLISELKNVFKCVVISHIPISNRGIDLSQDDNETRIWYAGSAEYTDSRMPTKAQVSGLLFDFLELLTTLYGKDLGLFLHPYFFDEKNHSGASMPPICQSVISDAKVVGSTFTQPKTLGIEAAIDPGNGYVHTDSVISLRMTEVSELHDRISHRIDRTETTYQDDAANCLIASHEISHALFSSRLFPNNESMSSSLSCCATSTLRNGALSATGKRSDIAGMFWITCFTDGAWTEKHQTKYVELIRHTWLLALSNHVDNQRTAELAMERERGSSDVVHQLTKQIRKIYSDIELINAQLLSARCFPNSGSQSLGFSKIQMPDSVALACMWIDAQEGRLRELPQRAVDLLVGGISQESIEKEFDSLAWHFAVERVKAETVVIETLQCSPETSFWSLERDYKPELSLDPEQFSIFSTVTDKPQRENLIKGLYPLLLLALRSAYEHAFMHSILSTQQRGKITLTYQESEERKCCLCISNTGGPPVKKSRGQEGWIRDLRLFEGLTGKWRIRLDNGVASSHRGRNGGPQEWQTKIAYDC